MSYVKHRRTGEIRLGCDKELGKNGTYRVCKKPIAATVLGSHNTTLHYCMKHLQQWEKRNVPKEVK